VALHDLPKHLYAALWARVIERLNQGETMVNNHQFEMALAEEYSKLLGRVPSAGVYRHIQQMVSLVNSEHPDTYLAQGLQNSVRKAFEQGVRKLKWDVAKIQERGVNALRRFSRREEVAELLDDLQLDAGQIDVLACVVSTLREMQGQRPRQESSTPATAPQLSWADFTDPEARQAAPDKASTAVDGELQAAVALGEVSKAELDERHRQQEGKRQEIEKREEARIPEHLPALVERGLLTQEEADKVQALRQVDERLKKGEIDEKEASRIRNSLLEGKARDELERKVREALSQAVLYLQVFAAMQRIDPQNDQALGFLIRHKEVVTASSLASEEGAATLKALMGDAPMLEGLINIMERKDQELRMLAVRLPPYNAVMSRGLEKIGNMTIEESFLSELRQLDEEEVSRRLNSPLKEKRVRPAADMRCLICLVDHVTKRTPFRKELRSLRVNQALEEFFRSTTDLKQARHQAENFLNRRLRRLFPDMSAEESSELKQRGAQMIDAIEHKVLEERRQAVEGRRRKAEESQARGAESPGEAGEELELSEEERQKGVQIGRVEVRVAGNMRRIPYKIMPDPEDPAIFVIVQRDPDTGELVPQMRRGAKRVVEKGKDGVWRPTRD
jgi:hypothetical protein